MTYKYDVIPLTEGLDFNTATSLSKPGSLRDCMNYEFVDGAGLRRINGYRPYDGTNLSPQDKLFFIKYTGAISTNAVFDLFPWLYVFDSVENPNSVPFGYVVNTSSTLPSHTVGPTTYTLVPFVKINCPRYADPFMRPNSIAKLLNSAALNISYDTSDILSPAELSDADYNAVFGTTTKSALTELEFLKGTGLSQERSNNHIATGYSGAGSAHDDGPGKFSAVAEMWCEEKDGVTYSIGDAMRVTGLANGITIYPGDYAFLRMNPTNYLNPWLVLNVQADAGFGAGETVVLNVVPMLGHVMETGDDAYKKAWSPFYNSVDGDAEGTSLRLYRNPGSDALTSINWFWRWGEVDLEYGPEVAVMWTRHSEEGALTAGDVYCTNSINISGGSSHTLAWSTGATASLEYTDANGSAEYMPLLASGVIKAVIPTRAGSGYSGTGTVTYDNNGTGSGGANTTYRSNCIERIYPRFHHTGWIIPFDTGNKASGFLTKINRFKDNSDVVYDDDTITGKTCTQYIHNIQNSTVPYSGTSNSARIFNDQWKTTSGSATDSASIVSAISANDGTTITNSYDWGRFSTSSVAYTSTSGFIGFSGLAGTIPEDSTIRGIAVTARVEVTASANSSTIYTDGGATIRASLFKNGGAVQLGNPLEMLSASGSLKDTWNAATMAETVFTAGSSTNTWGNTPLKLEDILDPTFGVAFDIRLDRNDSTVSPTGTFVIDHVTLEVTYEIPSVRLYFADANTGASGAYAGHTVISGDLLDYVVSKGSFENGDAEGYFTVVNLRTLHGTGTNPYYSVLNNYYVYNNPTLTNQIALTSGNMEFNGLDSYRTIKAADTLYTCHRANLYSNADYDTFFICSGAGRARQFDGKYLSKIYAISPSQENSEVLDRPRHACTKNFSLFLGYESGQVLFSAPGDPANFSAFDGAGEIGIGDNVVGLQNMPVTACVSPVETQCTPS